MRCRLFVTLAVALPMVARAQSPGLSSIREDSTLAGIQTVGLLISDANGALGAPLVAQLAASTTLELRKTGLRVIRIDTATKAGVNFDALVQVLIYRRGRFGGDDVDMRYLVRQPVTLVRTQKQLWETTWIAERRGQNLVVKDAVPRMLTEAINEFLSKWLDMNGR